MIQVTFIENGKANQVTTVHGAYANLMYLLRDNLFDDSFGECGGMGKCATCQVKIIDAKGNIAKKARNEPETLRKHNVDHPNIRLSCQLHIDNNLDGVTVEILGLE